jgi:hypothetical protein
MGQMEAPVIIAGVLVLWYLISWEYKFKREYATLGLAFLTFVQSVYFLTYVTFTTTQPEHTALLTTLTLMPPVFDLIRGEYPDIGVVMSTLALLMFSTSNGVDNTFRDIGIILAILPIGVAVVYSYLRPKNRT